MNIINLNLPKVNFYVHDLQEKYTHGLLKDHLDALQYIQEYYFESSNGIYYFYNVENNDFEFKTDKDFKKEVLDKVGNCKILSVCRIFPIHSRNVSLIYISPFTFQAQVL